MLIAGANQPIRDAFTQQPEYWLRTARRRSTTSTPNGFDEPPPDDRERWRAMTADEQRQASRAGQQFRLTQVSSWASDNRLATDDWPMLYLREPMIPGVSLRGGAVMGVIALLLLAPFLRRVRSWRPRMAPALLLQMFFLGAGFMLVETKAVVHMALLFGGTWIVNSVVIFAVLVMILGANLFVALARPVERWPVLRRAAAVAGRQRAGADGHVPRHGSHGADRRGRRCWRSRRSCSPA